MKHNKSWMYFTLLCLIFLITLTTSLKAQKNSEEYITKILNSANQKFVQSDYIGSLQTSELALNLLSNTDKSTLKRKGNIYAAKSLIEIGLLQQALTYLDNAELLNKKEFSINVKIEIHRLRGRIFGLLNLDHPALDEFHKQKFHSRYITDSTEKNLSLFWSYENLYEIFQRKKWKDSANIYLHKQKHVLSKIKTNQLFYYESSVENRIGQYFLQKKNTDSAEKHLNKSLNILKNNKANFSFDVLISLAELKMAQNKSEEAIQYYQNALNNAKILNDLDAVSDIYLKLSSIYIDNNISIEQARNFLKKANQTKAKLDNSNKRAVDLALKTLLKTKETEVSNYFKLIISISAITLIIIIILISILLIRKKRKKQNDFQEKLQQHLEHKDNLGNENKFKHLISLAKSNSPEFLLIFKELYPDFINFIKHQDPKVRSSELSFLAMTFLNFSTKDISEYTFVTVRAVQIRKNRLRKKYNIPSEYDFNTWMRLHGNLPTIEHTDELKYSIAKPTS